MSAYVSTERTRSADGHFEIVCERRDDDDPWSSDQSYAWEVVDVRTRKTLGRFHGTERWHSAGHTTMGVNTVAFDPDGIHVVATHHDGTVERLRLRP